MSDDMSYPPYRISMKQEKLYKAMTQIREMKRRPPRVIGIPKLQTIRGLKEIVSGLAMPRKDEK